MGGLVADMCHENPDERPTMDQVVSRFKAISDSLDQWKLTSRVADRSEFFILGAFRGLAHWSKQIGWQLRANTQV
jgi:hypothetical protein